MKENSDGTFLTYAEYLELNDLCMEETLKQAKNRNIALDCKEYALCAANIMNKEE